MTGQTRRQVGLMVVGLLALAASTAYTTHQAQVIRARQIIDAGETRVVAKDAASGVRALLGAGKAPGPPGTPSGRP